MNLIFESIKVCKLSFWAHQNVFKVFKIPKLILFTKSKNFYLQKAFQAPEKLYKWRLRWFCNLLETKRVSKTNEEGEREQKFQFSHVTALHERCKIQFMPENSNLKAKQTHISFKIPFHLFNIWPNNFIHTKAFLQNFIRIVNLTKYILYENGIMRAFLGKTTAMLSVMDSMMYFN